MNKIISLFLLIVMSFSIVHGVVLDIHEKENHCSVQEYVAEFSAPIHDHTTYKHENDACDTHYIFHISFLLPEHFSLFEFKIKATTSEFLPLPFPIAYLDNSFRPPIA